MTPSYRPLLLILTAFGLLALVNTLVIPLFEAPDELWHFNFVHYLATEHRLPVQPTEDRDIWLRETGQPPLYYLLTAPLVAVLDTDDFPAFVRFNVAHPAITPTSTSDAPNLFIHTSHERFPYRQTVLAVHLIRLLTILWGIGTLVGTYLLTRQILPDRPGLASVVTALVAFNPHFIYINSVLNNDGAAICLATGTLYLAIRLLRPSVPSRRDLLALGLLLGLALLGKISALALLLPVGLALLLRWWRDRDLPALLRRGLLTYGLALLIAGWWYGRNHLLYGDPLAWNIWLTNVGTHTVTLPELLRQCRHVGTSFWAPYDRLFPAWIFRLLGLLAALAALGWLRLIYRLRRRLPVGLNRDGLLVIALWFILLFVSLLRYMAYTPAAAGRLLFPGLASFALLLALGWDVLLPHRCSQVFPPAVVLALLLLAAYTPLGAIRPRYALAFPLADEKELTAATPLSSLPPTGGVRLVGVRLQPEETPPGEPVAVTLYWKAVTTPTSNLRAVVRLWTLGGRLVGQDDRTPAGETYPPDLWRPGDLVRDRRRIIPETKNPALCRVTVSILAGDRPLGEASSPPLLRLTGEPVVAPPFDRPYTLGNVVELVGCDLQSTGEGLRLLLYWRPLAQPAENYTVFVHLLDDAGHLVAQGDGPPLGGDYPTSCWRPGELLADYHDLPVDALPKGGRLLVGLYRPDDSLRLPTDTADNAIPLTCPGP